MSRADAAVFTYLLTWLGRLVHDKHGLGSRLKVICRAGTECEVEMSDGGYGSSSADDPQLR